MTLSISTTSPCGQESLSIVRKEGMPTNGYLRFARLCSKKITRQPTLYNCMYKDTIQNTISHLPSSISKMQIKDNSVTTSVN